MDLLLAMISILTGDPHKDAVDELFLVRNVIRKWPLIIYCRMTVAGTGHLFCVIENFSLRRIIYDEFMLMFWGEEGLEGGCMFDEE